MESSKKHEIIHMFRSLINKVNKTKCGTNKQDLSNYLGEMHSSDDLEIQNHLRRGKIVTLFVTILYLV